MANKVLISSIVVAVLMIAFSVFISATGNLFAKAQATPITGHIVLYEATLPFTGGMMGSAWYSFAGGVTTYEEIVFLPGDTCEVLGNCTYSTVRDVGADSVSARVFWGGAIRPATITNLGNYKYKVYCPFVADQAPVNHVSISFKC